MIIVHHLENSRSQRILWLLEELGVEYRVERYARDPKTSLAPAALKAVHPLGKSPVLTDGELVVAESGAIIEYLIEAYGHGRFAPAPGTPEWRRYRYWMHAAEGSVMAMLVMKLVFNRTTQAPVPFFLRPITRAVAKQVGDGYIDPALRAQLELMERELASSEWFAGDELSGADFQMIFAVEAASARSDLADRHPKLRSYLEKVHARPAYQRALEAGGPYELMS